MSNPDSASNPPSLTEPCGVRHDRVSWRNIFSYLHPGESEPDFAALYLDVMSELAPADIIERLWCDDIVALIWESHRLRRVKRALLAVQENERLRDRLMKYEHVNYRDLNRVMSARHLGDRAAIEKVERAIAADPLGVQDGPALDHLEDIEKMLAIDKSIEAADKRRDALLSNLYVRREMLGERVTKSIPYTSS